MNGFDFKLLNTKGHARAGEMTTPHGKIKTPVFMPVGTVGTVKSLDTQDIEKLNAQIILGNTYHLYLRPGTQRLKTAGGLHKFMGWNKPILTDSGGFQVFSLGAQQAKNSGKSMVKITEDEVIFKSHLDGTTHTFTPQKAINIQAEIGADIVMAFDQCTVDDASTTEAEAALNRTNQWAKLCYEQWEKNGRQSAYGNYQALFGIVQGAMSPELRMRGLKEIKAIGFDGIAIGGETVGYNMIGTGEVMDWIRPELPTDKPVYAMGLGLDPANIVSAIKMGFDMFDCVAPTRLARNGTLYAGQLVEKDGDISFSSQYNKGRLQIGNNEFASDQQVIQVGCDCETCKAGYSRSYLNHLYRSHELTYYRLASIHNVRFMVRLSEQMREWIVRN